MSARLNVAFLWHFHQPDYAHPEDGVPVLPWVRMHGVRGYTDMLAALEEEPGARVTLNVTPVLLRQIERCLETWGSEHEDRLLRRCRKLPCPLAEGEKAALAALLFSAHRQQMVAPLPRYLELLERCEPALKGQVRIPLDDAEFLDLAVLFHLAWSGFRLRREPQVQALIRKGRHFAPADLAALLELHRSEIATLLPRLGALRQRGQVELTTTPDQHPILPLLCRLESSEFPQSGGLEAPFTFERPDDAADHVARAVATFRRHFGAPPSGMWPAEGAVSEAAVRQLARGGVRFAATDEAILFQSLSGAATSREELLRPHSLATPDGEVALFFRDHELSDRIGFLYQSWPAESAVRDLMKRLDELRAGSAQEEPTVALILDGENPWESYAGAGEPFLKALWRELAGHPRLVPVTIAEALDRAQSRQAVGRLTRLAKGSWIGGNLDTWAGQREKLDGWRLLAEARALFAGRPLAELEPPVAASLRALEGSDWYWWFGDDHFTAQRELFAELFHAHLRVVFRAVGREPPPLPPPDARREDLRPTREPLEPVRARGRAEDLFEWQSAGWFEFQPSGGAMTRARRVARRLLFGFESGVIHLAVEREAPLLKGRLFFAEPRPRGFDCVRDDASATLPWLRFEIALQDLAAAPGATLRFRIELETEDGEVLHWPAGRLARLRVPDREFAAARWYV
jgi:alpha-amylase/alpha-mannosidase (GH57 family)